jgi:hypothetical protein
MFWLAGGLPDFWAPAVRLLGVLRWRPAVTRRHPPSPVDRQVTCLYVTRSPSTAAFLPEWDQWREAGVGYASLIF